VIELRRTQAGIFEIEDALTLEQLQAMNIEALMSQLIAVDKPLHHLPLVTLSESQTALIKHGQSLQLDQHESILGRVRMYGEHVFLGLGEIQLGGRLLPKKIFNLQNEIV
jgi:tRNA pseudouridine55 synthase